MQLNKCKYCSEKDHGYAKPFVRLDKDGLTFIGTVKCHGCGAKVTIELPTIGNESENDLDNMVNSIEQIAAMSWNMLNA